MGSIMGAGSENSSVNETLCKKCRAVSWSRISRSLKRGFPLMYRIPTRDFHAWRCRMCQLLPLPKTIIPSSTLSIQMDWFPSSSQEQSQLRELVASVSNGQMWSTKALEVLRCSAEGIKKQTKDLPNVDLNLAKNWLQECKSTHQHCNSKLLHTLQALRVIDCKRKEVVGLSTLVDCRFVALSYVSGGKTHSKLLSSSSLAGDFPQTIEDSITVTQALGFRYLWVDRYVSPASYLLNHSLMI
jgi:hypothetical protein